MNVSERLDSLRREIPHCSLVSFGDLQTGLALLTSAQKHHEQEYLQEIVRQAATQFAKTDTLAGLLPGQGPAANDTLLATPEDIRIFARSRDCQSDVLCCVCHDQKIETAEAAVVAAQKLLHDLAGVVG